MGGSCPQIQQSCDNVGLGGPPEPFKSDPQRRWEEPKSFSGSRDLHTSCVYTGPKNAIPTILGALCVPQRSVGFVKVNIYSGSCDRTRDNSAANTFPCARSTAARLAESLLLRFEDKQLNGCRFLRAAPSSQLHRRKAEFENQTELWSKNRKNSSCKRIDPAL